MGGVSTEQGARPRLVKRVSTTANASNDIIRVFIGTGSWVQG